MAGQASTATQAPYFSSDQIGALTTTNFAYLSSTALGGLSSSALAGITALDILGLTTNNAAGYTAQANALVPQYASLNADAQSALVSILA